jgi:ATP-dependent RNA helicase RhlE
MTKFTDLELAQPILRAIEEQGYNTPTPIQARAIPPMLDGRDIMGIAQTGTGKTAAFSLPILHRLAKSGGGSLPKRSTRALILAPTRELAGQISACVKTYSQHMGLRSAVVYGGVSIRGQIANLARGVDVLVATPGRLLDLINQKCLSLDWVEVFVLDEADRMLDMGFSPDVKRIAAMLPRQHQTAMFSATMAKTVQGLAESLLNDPVRVEVAPVATTIEKIDQRVLFVSKSNKRALLGGLLKDSAIERALIFTRTKHGADKVARHLEQRGVRAGVIHGNKSQNARERAIKEFGSGRMRVMVATDIAARGIDIDGITHVINFDLPNEPDSYVHRIGRTARAGAVGTAISFCDVEEKAYLVDIEKNIRQSVPVFADHPFHCEIAANDSGAAKKKGRGGGNGGNGGNRGPSGNKGGGNRRHKPQQWKRNSGRKAA